LRSGGDTLHLLSLSDPDWSDLFRCDLLERETAFRSGALTFSFVRRSRRLVELPDAGAVDIQSAANSSVRDSPDSEPVLRTLARDRWPNPDMRALVAISVAETSVDDDDWDEWEEGGGRFDETGGADW
jgi:hypothetical protein